MDKGNYYETGITDQFHEILAELKPGLVLDIGMNIGWVSDNVFIFTLNFTTTFN